MRRAAWLRSLAATLSNEVHGLGTRSDGQELPNKALKDDSNSAVSTDPKSFPEADRRIEIRSFNVLKLFDWQTHCTQGDRALLPPALLYHGGALGPRPLLILDHSLPFSNMDGSDVHTDGLSNTQLDAIQSAAAKYTSMISQLVWEYGAVYIPLVVNPDGGDVIGRSCRQVCAVMDALDIRWSHFLTYSYGTLVAGRLAASQEYPHRIGSFLSLDTPLVTDSMVRNAKRRDEIAKAEKDVNVPADMLSFARDELLGALEEVLSCPAPKADGELYKRYLFNPKQIYEKGGLIRKEERYVSLRHLAGIHHPWQLMVPAGQPLSDVPVHKEFFRLRRPAVIKSAASHKELFSDCAATEIAEVLTSWMNRFEPDMMIRRRYEQAAREMSALVADATAATPKVSTSAGTGSGGKRKKEKKQKAG
ncbi:unnamed protein product [Phytomonas sp. EM1]|nr:unnamed protein product [Phytomonas sp. EM1]|eukprot:CCW63944.1 unnamed protein product [Phytomonas sp. isolate EM1]